MASSETFPVERVCRDMEQIRVQLIKRTFHMIDTELLYMENTVKWEMTDRSGLPGVCAGKR